MNDTAPLEVMPEEQQLLVVVQQNALPPEAGKSLLQSFAPSFKEVHAIIDKSRAIVVTNPTQKLDIKFAREYRLALRGIRVAADKIRKELKETALRQGRAIDGCYNILLALADGEEKRLEEQERYVEIMEAKRVDALRTERTKIATENGIDPMLYQLGDMSEETFQNLVEGTKLARAAQKERELKAEADRIAKEKADAEEREKQRLELERLKKEADEKEAALKAEREAQAEKDRLAEEERKRAEEVARKERESLALLLEEQQAKSKAEAERLAEIARKEREELEAKAKAEQARLEAEAKKLRDEQEAKAEIERKKLEAARVAAEASAKKERLAREKLEADARAQREAAAAAAKKAAAAPDKEKLLAFAAAIRAVEMPVLTSEGAVPKLATLLIEQREKFAQWIEDNAAKL